MQMFPFEFHLTVTVDNPSRLMEFVETCKSLNVKALFVGLNQTATDVMTSSRMIATYEEAKQYVKDLKDKLTRASFAVIREKIETVPWYLSSNALPEGTYYECHIQVPVTPVTDYTLLHTICKRHDGHVSRNLFKGDTENGIQMITVRGHKNKPEFEKATDTLYQELRQAFGLEVSMEKEYVIFDSNISHDAAWLGA